MKPDFTPAGWRVLAEAARWTSCADDAPLDLPELLLGLLAEEECRAAALLASRSIDANAVRLRWPTLRPIAAPSPGRTSDFSHRVQSALTEARQRLAELPQPLALATEHLLLGIVLEDSDVAQWIADYGLRAVEIERRIFRWEGVSPGPIDIADCGLRIADCGATPHAAKPQAGGRPAVQDSQSAVLRLVDASANRAREALRVIEDYTRFVLDDSHLTARLKQLRHDLATALQQTPTSDLLASRDTLCDVGTQISTGSEQTRAGLTDVVTANFKRLQESLRSLEEYIKTIDAGAAGRLEQIRYQVYTLERGLAITKDSLQRLAQSYLYVLVDGRESLTAFEQLVTSLIAAGVHMLQLRDKRLADRELLIRARRLRELTWNTRTLFIMNDRPDLAALSQADGVHVGQEELLPKDARSIVGPRALIGVSTHSIEQARQAVLEGANYIGVGPTFPSQTKHFNAFTGLDLLRAVSVEIRLPAFAIGGVTLENLSQVLATGMTRVAVSAAVTHSVQPADAARAFLDSLADLRA